MIKRIISIMLVLALIWVVIPVTARNNYQTDWVCLQRDEFRRGQADSREQLGLPMDIRWTADIGNEPSRTIIIGKSIAVIGTKAGKVSGFSLATGERMWTHDLGHKIVSDMALSNEFVCVPLENGRVVGLDLYTGGTFWETKEESNVISLIPSASTIYSITEEGIVRAFQSANGLSYWKYDLKTKVSAPASLLNYGLSAVGQMIIPTTDDRLIVFNYQQKKIDWEFSLDSPSTIPVIPTGEALIVTENSGRIFCIDSRSKELYWNFQTEEGATIESYPAVFNTYSYIACATTNGKIHAYRIGDGFKVWTSDAGSKITQPVIGIGKNIIVATDDGYIKGYHAMDGSETFAVNLGEKIACAPSYSAGVIVVATESGKLHGIAPSTGSVTLTLYPPVVIINPGGVADVTVELTGDEEISGEKFYMTPRGFPCRCKITRDLKPSNVLTIGEERTLHLTADDKAPTHSYDYNILCRSYNPNISEVVANGIILVTKESEMMKVSMTPSLENKITKIGVGFAGAKFLRSFSVQIKYNPDLLKPLSVNKTMAEASNLYWDFETPGKLRVFVAFTEGTSFTGDGSPFEILFEGMGTGTDTLDLDIVSRSNSGTILPARSISTEVSVEKSLTKHVVSLQINNIVAKIDDVEITLDVAPYIKAGRTMVPLRFVGEAMGAGVEWIPDERAVIYTNTLATGARAIKIWIGKTTALVDGIEMEMDAAPEILNGRTCVGVSFVSKNFGVETGWDGATKTVTLTYEN
jgi:outer membrane protein assembly factor BamB